MAGSSLHATVIRGQNQHLQGLHQSIQVRHLPLCIGYRVSGCLWGCSYCWLCRDLASLPLTLLPSFQTGTDTGREWDSEGVCDVDDQHAGIEYWINQLSFDGKWSGEVVLTWARF